jgi:4-hydroxy-tetrahydrodipicolinate synthase
MSWDEHIMLIAHTANRFGSQLAVIGNTGSNATREAVKATCQGFAVGMDAALHINPYYGKTSRDGLIYHFQAVLDYGPVIAYNVPGRTGQDIPSDVVLELAKHPNFAGVKECTGNDRIRAYTQQGVTCWTGNDDEAHDARWGAGAVGVISVTSNVVPGLMHRLMFAGADPELNACLQPLMRWLFLQPNPIGVNTLLAMLGAAPPVFRLPYAPYGAELRAEGAQLLATLGLQHCVHGPGAQPALREVQDWTLLELY